MLRASFRDVEQGDDGVPVYKLWQLALCDVVASRLVTPINKKAVGYVEVTGVSGRLKADETAPPVKAVMEKKLTDELGLAHPQAA